MQPSEPAGDAGRGAAAHARRVEHAMDGGVVYVPPALPGSPSAPPMPAPCVARCEPYRTNNALPPKQGRRAIQEVEARHTPASLLTRRVWRRASRSALHTLLTLSDVHIVLIPQGRWSLPESAPSSWFLCQPLQAFLHKPLDPLVGMTTAHANGGGNVGDCHPVSQE